ncbi:MAG: ABC transporter permease [Deltaproteobacteria bacterium]|nr:ABC transporter permease [Deltaproteobacteria bacterium]
MHFVDLLYVSTRQLLRQRRYLGVVLAIALGTAGLITMITMSRDFKRNLHKDLNLIGGVTVMRVYFDNALAPWPQSFQAAAVDALRQLPGVMRVSLVASTGGKTNLSGGREYRFPVVGVDEHFWAVRSFWALTGSLFTSETVAARKRECVLGATLADRIFGNYQLKGQTLEIYKEGYEVTGVLGGITDLGLSDCAFLPLTTVLDRFPGVVLTDRLYLRCITSDDVPAVAAAVPEVVQQYQSAQYLRVHVPWEGLRRVQRVFWWTEFFIYLAIGATFILGGAGIWNVMMAAVRSRTREIGLKKALGAEDKDILAQFLTEAILLSCVAFVAGAVLARLIVAVMGWVIDSPPPAEVFWGCLGLTFLFALILGLGAGFYPSLHASRMEVVDAIRYE